MFLSHIHLTLSLPLSPFLPSSLSKVNLKTFLRFKNNTYCLQVCPLKFAISKTHSIDEPLILVVILFFQVGEHSSFQSWQVSLPRRSTDCLVMHPWPVLRVCSTDQKHLQHLDLFLVKASCPSEGPMSVIIQLLE